MDAGIVVWDCKRAADSIRPISAIRFRLLDTGIFSPQKYCGATHIASMTAQASNIAVWAIAGWAPKQPAATLKELYYRHNILSHEHPSIRSDSDLIDLPGFTHRSFSDLPLLAAGNDRGKWDEALRNFQIARAFTHGFFDKYLKADKQTVLDAKSPPDERVKVDHFGPAAKAEASRSTSP